MNNSDYTDKASDHIDVEFNKLKSFDWNYKMLKFELLNREGSDSLDDYITKTDPQNHLDIISKKKIKS